MISNLFCAFGKQEELRSRVEGKIAKKWLEVRTRDLSMFERVGLLFRQPECNPVPELMISRQKIGLLSSFLVMEVRRQDKGGIHPIRYLI